MDIRYGSEGTPPPQMNVVSYLVKNMFVSKVVSPPFS